MDGEVQEIRADIPDGVEIQCAGIALAERLFHFGLFITRDNPSQLVEKRESWRDTDVSGPTLLNQALLTVRSVPARLNERPEDA